MIILNLDLGEDLEREFYKKINHEKISYLKYVEELIINDLKTSYYANAEQIEPLEVVSEDE